MPPALAYVPTCVRQGGHEWSAEAVSSGQADVAAIDVGVWLRLQRDRPELVESLRVLDGDCTLPHVPIQVCACYRGHIAIGPHLTCALRFRSLWSSRRVCQPTSRLRYERRC